MRTSFNGSPRSEPGAVFYSRATVDLAARGVRVEDVPCRNLEDVLGGFGRSFQILAERTITSAFTPENPLIINTGVLTASNVTTGLRTYFSAYSPLKGSDKGLPAAMWSAGSCKFGPKLKWTGLDEVILEGRADAPVYLVIRHTDQGPQIALEPAGDLQGLTCHEKIMWLRDRYADAHFAAIGPAGEHYEDCYMASVALSTENQLRSGDDKCRWAGRGGMGAVMGYKRVLAIVAQAPDKIAKLKPEIRDINKAVTSGPGSRKFREKEKGGLGGTWSNYEPLEKFHFVPQNNFRPTGDGKPELMFRDNVQPDFVVKAESCFRCGISCHKNVYEKNADGTRGAFLAKFDYEPVDLLSTNLGIHDPRKAAALISLVDRLGMDNISVGTTISYVMDYNERHPDAPILNGATFGDFDKAFELVEGAGTGRCPEVGHGVKRLSQSLGETGYAMHCKGLEFPAYQPDTNPGYPWAIAGGHMSMATYMAVALEGNTSLDYWATLITTRGLLFVRDDLLGLCKFAGVTGDHAVEALKQEAGIDVTTAEMLAAVRRAFVRALWLERRQGYERAEYTLPSEVFDRPNPNLGVPPFVTREFFSALSDRVWAVFDPEIDQMAHGTKA